MEVRDAAKRVIRQIENARIMCAEGAVETTESRVAEYTYAPDGGLTRLILINSTTGNQVTTWTYGTRLVSSGIARSDLPSRKTYPTGEFEVQTYNRQGAIKTLTDPNGTVHTYSYDILGRLTDDSITVLAPGVDGMVRRLSKSYDDRGRVQYLTSASDPNTTSGTIINQVKRNYNGIDCLISEAQSHSGAVDDNTPKVQYQCSAAVNNILRNTSVIYPNGRSVSYEYGGADSIDDVINRVQSVHDNDLIVLAEFQYFGVSQPAVTTYPQPSVQRRWKKLAGQPTGDAGDPYTGYDRFGRIEQMLWIKDAYVPAPLVHVQWGYNRASLKTWRKDLLAPSSANQDQYFTYDDLYQVTERQQGLLNTNTTGVSGIAAQQENFVYDQTGNWLQYQQREAGEFGVNQKRVDNQSNQIIHIDGNGTGVSYDKNGNMLEVPTGGLSLDGQPRELVWDAWNRLRKVTDDAANVLAEYEYDTQNRRTVSTTTRACHTYYNEQWRSIEERLGESNGADCQYVWNPTDRWELLLRDRSSANNGTLDERLYSLKDEFDPVAICDASGEIQERYAYSAFGIITVLDEDFVERNANESEFAWDWLFHAEFRDDVTDWYNYGYRYYVADLGRWISRDPIGEIGGVDLYTFVAQNVVNRIDYLGLSCEEDDNGLEWSLWEGLKSFFLNLFWSPSPVDNSTFDAIRGTYDAAGKIIDRNAYLDAILNAQENEPVPEQREDKCCNPSN